jgi:hypothetical protein
MHQRIWRLATSVSAAWQLSWRIERRNSIWQSASKKMAPAGMQYLAGNVEEIMWRRRNRKRGWRQPKAMAASNLAKRRNRNQSQLSMAGVYEIYQRRKLQ